MTGRLASKLASHFFFGASEHSSTNSVKLKRVSNLLENFLIPLYKQKALKIRAL